MTEYTHTEIANRIIEMGVAKNFIAIAIGMLNDRECDLNGQVARYANDMSAIMRKAEHELDEWKETEDAEIHAGYRLTDYDPSCRTCQFSHNADVEGWTKFVCDMLNIRTYKNRVCKFYKRRKEE